MSLVTLHYLCDYLDRFITKTNPFEMLGELKWNRELADKPVWGLLLRHDLLLTIIKNLYFKDKHNKQKTAAEFDSAQVPKKVYILTVCKPYKTNLKEIKVWNGTWTISNQAAAKTFNVLLTLWLWILL